MALLTSEGERIVADLAQQYGVSTDAVTHLLMAVNIGYGTQAQFNHPELGGMGQWSQGGMTMVGDMFNNGLKFTVDNLCSALSAALANGALIKTAPPQAAGSTSSFQMQGMQGGTGWPEELGQPSSSGAQNNLRYAVFPQTNRLAIESGGRITIYDTADHVITGFSQQQSGDQSITFTSQYGVVRVADLKQVSKGPNAPIPAPVETDVKTEVEASFETSAPTDVNAPTPEPATSPTPIVQAPAPAAARTSQDSAEDIIGLIEKLAALHDKGILTDSEFETKKSELLSRL